MSAVTVQEIIEKLRWVGYGEVADRIQANGIAPPDGMVLVKDEPVCWAIIGDGKFGEKDFGDTVEPFSYSVGYWTDRGYEATPLYAAPEVKP